MPRLNRHGEVATDWRGWAIGARWLTDDVAIFQQPVTEGADVWQMATRSRHLTGRGEPMQGVTGGCNALAAGGGAWMRRLDGAAIVLSGSRAWSPDGGRVGDVDRDGGTLALSEDALTMVVDQLRTFYRVDVQGETRYMDGLIAWTSRGQVRVFDSDHERMVDVEPVGDGAAKALAFRLSGEVWVLYQTDAHGGACHPADDASMGYQFGTPEHIYAPDVLLRSDGSALVAWAEREAETPADIRRLEIPLFGAGLSRLVPVVTTPTPAPPPPPPPPPMPTPPMPTPVPVPPVISPPGPSVPVAPPVPPVDRDRPFEQLGREAAESIVAVLYDELLDRAPDAFGRDYYVARLLDGRMTEADVKADIVASYEYRSRQGLIE